VVSLVPQAFEREGGGQ